MESERPNILVIDDDRRLRDLLRCFLIGEGLVVVAVADAAQARECMASLLFDLLIVDVMMPGEDGITFTRSLRSTHDVPVLMLTALSEGSNRIAGLEAGADDYLAKPFEPRELLLRINVIVRRRPPPVATTPRLFRLGECVFDVDRRVLQGADGCPVRLTGNELALLSFLIAHPGVTFRREDLADVVNADPAGRAVDVHVARLRKKIESNVRDPEILLTVRGKGYALRAH